MITTPIAWDFTAGCEDPAIARDRAGVMYGLEFTVAAEFPDYSQPFWLNLATTAVAALLHAAALTHATPGAVCAWAEDGPPEEALAVLPVRGRLRGYLRVLRCGPGLNNDILRALVREAIATLASADPHETGRQPGTS